MDGIGSRFDILVTHVEKFHGLVKLFGQIDLERVEAVSKYLHGIRDELEAGQPLPASQILPGQSIILRCDGQWYRGKVNTLSGIQVSCALVDTGETQICSVSSIRANHFPQLQNIPPLAQGFVLGEVIPPAGEWSKPSIEFVRDGIQNIVCEAVVILRSHGYTFIRVYKRGSREPLAQDMVQCGMAVSGYPNLDTLPPAEHYTQPQIAVTPMVQQRGYRGPTSTNYPPHHSPLPPHAHSPLPPQHSSHLPPHPFQQQYSGHQGLAWSDGSNSRSAPDTRLSPVPRSNGYQSSSTALLFRPVSLETGTWYPVYISAVEEGPSRFSIQLESLTKKLEHLMAEINRIPLHPLNNLQFEVGTACLARYSLDKSIYRAVILSTSNTAKVLYLDYGNEEEVRYEDLYQLPESYSQIQMLSLPCSLYQFPELQGSLREISRKRFETFTDRPLNCRVMSIEQDGRRRGGRDGYKNIVQLYEDNVDIGQELRLWVGRQQGGSAIFELGPGQGLLPPGGSGAGGGVPSQGGQWQQGSSLQIARGAFSYSQVELVGTVDVFLSFHGKGPSLFYVQRSDTTKQIQQIMVEIANLIKTGPIPLSDPRPGSVCLAQYTDGVWYRARIEYCSPNSRQIKVEFVDFGNSDLVDPEQVYSIPPGLVTCLPAQAVPCTLAGNYGTQSENLIQPFLSLVKDNVFRIKVEKVLSNICVVQASTTVPPLLNINSELSSVVPSLALTPSMGNLPVQLLVTHFESSNSFYGQISSRGTELAIFLANLAEYCNRYGARIYSGLESHVGEVCATVDSSLGNFRYYRCKITREQRNTVDVKLLDVGGTERVERMSLIQLPEELKNQPEFGFQCSLGHTVSVNDIRLRNLFLDSFVEVVLVEDLGDFNVVKLTVNNNSTLRNNQILRFMKDISPVTAKPSVEPFSYDQNEKLKHLLDQQNKNARIAGGRSDGRADRPQHENDRPQLGRGRGNRNNEHFDQGRDRMKNRDIRLTGDDHRSARDDYRQKEESRVKDDYVRNDSDYRQNGRDNGYRRNGNVRKEDGYREEGYSGREDKYRDRKEEYRSRGSEGREDGRDMPRRFERGDLRNSLRERRAARELTLAKPIISTFKYPRLHPGIKFEGKISWMYNPGHFYLQFEENTEFNRIMEQMQIEFKSGPFDSLSWNKGTPVAAKYQDNCWYRGKVEGQRGKMVEVYFVDFGNTDKVDAIDVLALPAEFGGLETQAVKSSLFGLEEINGNWDKLPSGFAKFFTDSVFSVEVVKAGRHCIVNLNNGEVAEQILKEFREGGGKEGGRNRGEERLKKGRRKENSVERENVEKSVLNGSKDRNKSGKIFTVGGFPGVEVKEFTSTSRTVLVSHFNSWKEMWVQVDPDQTIKFTEELNKNENLHGTAVSSVKVGDICLAEWDGLWYRALVHDIKDEAIKVHFVDYGNTETVSVSEIRTGDSSQFKNPPFALRCKLDVKIGNFDKIMEKSEYTLKVKFKSFFKNQFVIKLDKEKTEKKENMKKKGDKIVTLTHVETGSRIWFIPEQSMEELTRLMEELSKLKDSLVAASEVKDGGVYAVRSSEDGELYRARVLNISEDGVEIVYIDYGNQDHVEKEEILDIPESLKTAPGYARLVQIKGADYALDCDELKEKLKEFLMDSNVSVNMTGKIYGTLSVDGKPLNLNSWLRFKKTLNLFQHLGSVRVDCYVSNTEPLAQIWIIDKGMLEGLERMMRDLQRKAPGFHKLKKVEKGRMVCAKFTEDGEYYRVRILELREETAEILYLDFGNRETVPTESLLELTPEFTLSPGLAMKVEIDSKGECRMLAPGEMESIISEGKEMTVELVQPRLNIVRLYLGGRRVGYQHPDEVGVTSLVSLPPGRLRLGPPRLGVLSMVSTSSFAVQDIQYAGIVEHSIRREEPEPVSGKDIEPGRIYLQQVGSDYRRLAVLNLNPTSANIKYLDTQMTTEISFDNIFSCPSNLLQLPPAALTAASLTVRTKDRYKLLNTLLLISVSEKSLNLEEVQLRVRLQLQSKDEFKTRFEFPELLLNLPNKSCIRNLSSEQLCTIRNSLVESYICKTGNLQLEMLEETKDDVVDELIDEENEIHSNQLFSNPQSIDAEKKCVKINDNLPEILLEDEEVVQIISVSHDHCILTLERFEQFGSDLRRDLEKSEKLELISPEPNSLALYCGGPTPVRCIVQEPGDTVEIYLVDSGQTMLCHSSELSSLPAPLSSIPPLAIQVQSSRSVKSGESFMAKFIFEDFLEILRTS